VISQGSKLLLMGGLDSYAYSNNDVWSVGADFYWNAQPWPECPAPCSKQTRIGKRNNNLEFIEMFFICSLYLDELICGNQINFVYVLFFVFYLCSSMFGTFW
jgi:hypothetical protein